ncbi:MAG: hypothetical protein GVY15_09340 [Bacteroidetes bacterium]|jgi:hypothetical protein|nr:hypothetical protein [Bacteroidota bacterium]
MAVQVNESAIAFLSEKIADGAFVSEGHWPDDRPANEEEISYIEEHGWNGFAKWHLALDTQASQFSKRRYEHLAGDFAKVHRSALMAAHAKAVKLGFDQVKAAAATLVAELDEAAGGPPENDPKPDPKPDDAAASAETSPETTNGTADAAEASADPETADQPDDA